MKRVIKTLDKSFRTENLFNYSINWSKKLLDRMVLILATKKMVKSQEVSILDWESLSANSLISTYFKEDLVKVKEC